MDEVWGRVTITQKAVFTFSPRECDTLGRKDESLHTSQVAHQVEAYPGFHSMKRLGVFLLHLRREMIC